MNCIFQDSRRIYTMDGDHLLSIGMVGLDDGTLTGMAVNIFDVVTLQTLNLNFNMKSPMRTYWSWSKLGTSRLHLSP